MGIINSILPGFMRIQYNAKHNGLAQFIYIFIPLFTLVPRLECPPFYPLSLKKTKIIKTFKADLKKIFSMKTF